MGSFFSIYFPLKILPTQDPPSNYQPKLSFVRQTIHSLLKGSHTVKNLKAENQEPGSQQKEDYGEPLSLSFLDVREVARYLKVKPSTIYSMAGNRKIPFYRIGRQLRFRKFEIDQWAERLKQPVIDTGVEARKVLQSIEKKSDLDINRITTKAVEDTKKKGYTSLQEKPGRIKGLREEVKYGAI